MKKRIYLDFAATTPVLPEVVKTMEKVLLDDYGNPSSLHEEGRLAKAHVQKGRETIAKAIGAETDEIFFTSGGTEANFLGLTGLARALKRRGNHLITSVIEHSSILGCFQGLESEGFEVTYLPVTAKGILDPEQFKNSIRKETILASFMMANNEIGTIQPLEDLVKTAQSNQIIFHTDAIQAFPHLPLNVKTLGVDAATLSAHKIYGPKGIGALYLKRGTPYKPVFKGGEQERKIRPGTENVAGIVGFAKATEILQNERNKESKRLERLRDRLIHDLCGTIEDCSLNGDPLTRLPNNVNLTFKGVDGESILIHLDLEGIACSMGSACSAGALEPSHVLIALGRTPQEAKSSIRFTLGKYTSEEELEAVKKVIPPFVEQLRSVRLK